MNASFRQGYEETHSRLIGSSWGKLMTERTIAVSGNYNQEDSDAYHYNLGVIRAIDELLETSK